MESYEQPRFERVAHGDMCDVQVIVGWARGRSGQRSRVNQRVGRGLSRSRIEYGRKDISITGVGRPRRAGS